MIEYIDRNWNLLFHRKECIHIKITIPRNYRYNEIILSYGGIKMRCLGNNYYKRLKSLT
jgi:hypothetical protein